MEPTPSSDRTQRLIAPSRTAANATPMARAVAIRTRASFFVRLRTMARVGLAMMFHDRLKMIGTLVGVVFAVVLSNQQAGTFLGLLYKNLMFPRNAGADIWIAAPGTETMAGGRVVNVADMYRARVTEGVDWAEPLLYGTVTVAKPGGGNEGVNLVGTKYPRFAGGPWNIVAGSRDTLLRPDTMLFEASERENLGGLNVGSVREVAGRKVTVGGFVWGLIPFGPSYAFADFELARELMHQPSDQVNYVLVGVKKGESAVAVRDRLRKDLPNDAVYTQGEFENIIIKQVLFRTPIGITFGTSTLFGLIVGFVIVALSMFSAVVDNIREFGTLKAVGARNSDLAMLLFVQSVAYGLMGSLIGLAIVSQMAKGIRSAKLALNLPPILSFGTIVLMIGMCIFASLLALMRIRKVEPAMVFR